MLVVSPHLDDAVLSCGALLAEHPGAHVVTVFAGWPKIDRVGVTPWDELCGFAAGDDVIGACRAEDADACAVLDAVPVWLDFVDDQYEEPVEVDAIAESLAAVIARLQPTELFIPLGLTHPDHITAHEACRRVVAHATVPVIAYEESPYRVDRRPVDARIVELEAAELHPRPEKIAVGDHDARKLEAIACYRSQVRGLGQAATLTEEQYWRLG